MSRKYFLVFLSGSTECAGVFINLIQMYQQFHVCSHVTLSSSLPRNRNRPRLNYIFQRFVELYIKLQHVWHVWYMLHRRSCSSHLQTVRRQQGNCQSCTGVVDNFLAVHNLTIDISTVQCEPYNNHVCTSLSEQNNNNNNNSNNNSNNTYANVEVNV